MLVASRPYELKKLVDGAASFAHEWRRFEERRVTAYRGWSPENEPKDKKAGRFGSTSRSAECLKWGPEHKQWQAAYNPIGLGIINDDGQLRLDLWRGMTELDGYICIVRQKRQQSQPW